MLQACMDEWDSDNQALLVNELAAKNSKENYNIKKVNALRCPGCNAPIKDINNNNCEYCGIRLIFLKEDK